jgi:hypothetical protein
MEKPTSFVTKLGKQRRLEIEAPFPGLKAGINRIRRDLLKLIREAISELHIEDIQAVYKRNANVLRVAISLRQKKQFQHHDEILVLALHVHMYIRRVMQEEKPKKKIGILPSAKHLGYVYPQLTFSQHTCEWLKQLERKVPEWWQRSDALTRLYVACLASLYEAKGKSLSYQELHQKTGYSIFGLRRAMSRAPSRFADFPFSLQETENGEVCLTLKKVFQK